MDSKVIKAVVSVTGKDNVGILAKVSGVCAIEKANIIEVTQSVLDQFFCMIMVIDVAQCESSIEEIKANIAKEIPNMAVYIMHEDIFTSMHTI